MSEIKIVSALAVAVVAGLGGAASAGRFELKESNGGEQDVVGTLRDDLPGTYKFKDLDNSYVNDEARSVVLFWVRPGTILRLYDDPDCGTGDDWVEIKVKRLIKSATIGTFQLTTTNPDYDVTYHADNGLDGKVSCAKLIKSAQPVARTQLEHVIYDEIEQAFDHFPAKYGTALERSYGDSEYRVYRPTIEERAGKTGWKFSIIVNHIRGWAFDDTSIATLELDSNGRVVKTSTTIDIGPTISSLWSGVAGTGDPEASLANRLGSVATKLVDKLEELNEFGGRLLFPEVISDQLSEVGVEAIDAIQGFDVLAPIAP